MLCFARWGGVRYRSSKQNFMTNPFWEIVVTEAPLVAPPARFSAQAGGVVEFWGVVRGKEGAEPITGIDYEAHVPMARRQLEILAGETAERFPLLQLVIHHRIGFVANAEPSLFVRAGAAHREPAFEAARWLIDELKKRVPIWKHPQPEQPVTIEG